MRTNANIITSGNQMAPPQLPDVNAMMQTRTAGMENIYALEQQRAEQAQTAQKEQEAEAMKALSPAIAAAFSDPSDAGLDAALALVPPQYQGAAKAQLDQIRALPDPNRRKDLIRAGLVQDEAGRTLLGQLEMTAAQRANLDVQREQNVLRREEIAQRRAEANQPPQMTPYQAEMIKLAQARDTREAGKVSPEAAKQQQAIREIDTAITKISEVAEPGGLIDMSTNSIAGNLLDNIVAQVSGGTLTLPGDVAAAQMEVIAHLARMAVPRFEGPQGVADAAIYERASGQLSDPTTSNTTKRAAAQTVVEMLKARRDQFAFSGAGNGGGASAAGGADSGVLEYDADGNLIE